MGIPDGRLTRRAALQAGALGAAGLAAGAVAAAPARAAVTQASALPLGTLGLDQGWLFGPYAAGAEQPGYGESGLAAVNLPHTVAALSWSEWTPSSWESSWIYRLHLSGAALGADRSFVDFQGVMTNATVYLNGSPLGTHAGGYLPFTVELTNGLLAGDNVLAVVVEGALEDVPPNDVAAGDSAVDFLQPAGIYRDVALRIVPEVFISDVFATPTNVLSSPGLEALVTIDAGAVPAGAVTVTAAVLDGATPVGAGSTTVTLAATGPTQVSVSVAGLAGIALWSPESPTLYGVQVSVAVPGGSGHTYTTRTGFREAVFTVNGFELNGAPYEIFGLNRHQLFPYTGMAAPERVQRRDAEILRSELNCNMVRCSHYPQSDWFLDACDELGLMVWEEPPGWAYVGDAAFQAVVLQNMTDLVTRDRSRPSLIVWATRLNETSSANNEALYAQTNAIAASLDGTRQTTGAMNNYSLTDWNQQLFAYDDYHSTTANGVTNATLNPPIGGVPYLVSEAVGALDGAPLYRFIDSTATLAVQARQHAQVHSLAGVPGYAGLLGWCGIDYASTNGLPSTPTPSAQTANTSTPADRIWRNLKTPGVLDTFRAPKPGASTYQGQAPAGAGPFIVPAFYWDFASGTNGNPNGPGSGAIAFTNCDSLSVSVGGTSTLTATPDTTDYPHLAHPPTFLNFPSLSGSGSPDLVIEGLIGGAVVTTLTMSSDTSRDVLQVTTDDASILADGTDATRFTIRVLDAYGNPRHFASGVVSLAVSGPGTLVADPSFDLGAYGTTLGGFIRGTAGAGGTVTLTAQHPSYGSVSAAVQTSPGTSAASAAGAGGPRSLNPEAVVAAPPNPAPAAQAPAPVITRRQSLSSARIRAALHRALFLSRAHARIAYVRAHGAIVEFDAPAAGELTIGWYATVRVTETTDAASTAASVDSDRRTRPRHRTRRVLVATASARIHRAGRARVHVHLTARGRTLLRHARSLDVSAVASFRFTRNGRRETLQATRTLELHR